MITETLEISEKKEGKKLYDYQLDAIEKIFNCLNQHPERYNLLFQLPTGGGKTVIFSKIAKRYIQESNKKVLILTHRIELCSQTSGMLDDFGVRNKIINAKIKELPDQDDFMCFVAMVETLNNRLSDEDVELRNIGLVIIDEAHINSFRKLFRFFHQCVILGVTATPLSSNINLPMKDNYNELIVGHSISELIEKRFLARATIYSYYVTLTSLTVGINGDYTVSSSERLYNNHNMQDKLLKAYEEYSKGMKTLIFNNGIRTSKHVFQTFREAGYEIMHLDNTNTEPERKEILDWFRNKPDAILTSVSILTTGFDEPNVNSIILNRATKSLTLYHQMIGRGSRVLPNKSNFTVIDLGNNAQRFGLWDAQIDWHQIFRNPDAFLESIRSDEEMERGFQYVMPQELQERFSKSESVTFDIKLEYDNVMREGLRPKEAIERSIEQHARMCLENSADASEAMELAQLLEDDIAFRVKNFSHCISKSTPNYLAWLADEYKRKLRHRLTKEFRTV